jgi:hypothetical protein
VENWHCSINGQQYGPVPTEELISWIQQGRVTASDSVWCEGMAQWAPAGNVPAFMGHFPQAPYAPPAQGQPQGAPRRYLRPHRGGAVLALGIIGLMVCCICGIIAWSMGSADLREMAAGRMDRSGEGMTSAGKICGMISVIMAVIISLVYIFAIAAASSSRF